VAFEQKLENIYGSYNKASAHVLANATAENNMIRMYGKEITGDLLDKGNKLSAGGHKLGIAEGLTQYEAKAGRYAGRTFLMDNESAILLDRMVNPSNIASRLKLVDQWTVWWKARATVLRPGFTIRNEVGNIHNLWLADVDNIIGTMAESASLQALRFADAPAGFAPITRSSLRRMAGKVVDENAIVSGTNMSGRQILDLAEEHKVFGASFSAQDLGGISKSASLNPASAKAGWLPANAKVNQAFEENARLALFIDRIRKGHTPADAAEAVAKFLFNYDEMSLTNQTLKTVMPFWTWNYKNWGLELQQLAKRPDKMFKLNAGKRALEAADPLTLKEAQYENQMEPSKGHMDIVRMPVVRGEEGNRKGLMLGNLFPSSSLKSIHRDRILGELGGLLNPIIQGLGVLVGANESTDYPGYMAFSGTRPRGSFRTAPTWVTTMMNSIEGSASPKAEGALMLLDKLFIKHQTENKYLWDSEIADGLQQIDPGFATLNRAFRHSDEKNYDVLYSILLGVKLQDYGIRKGTTDYEKKQKKAKEKEDLAKRNAITLGYER